MDDIKIGIIGGSGLGQLLSGDGQRHEIETPFGKPSDAITETNWQGLPVLLLSRHGPGHLLNPTQIPYRANIFALKKLGCTHIIATGAVGSLRQEMKPRDLVVLDQIIDRTTQRANTFFENAAVHVEFAEPFCPLLRQTLLSAAAPNPEAAPLSNVSVTGAAAASPKVHDRGCYVCMEGPAFSTRAESLMHRLWGGDLIGMTALPEAKLAREAEIAYALVAIVTDFDSWRDKSVKPASEDKSHEGKSGENKMNDAEALLSEIMNNLQTASAHAMELIRGALAKIAADPAAIAASPAHSALKLAIWSEKARIDSGEISRLAPMWERYFQQN